MSKNRRKKKIKNSKRRFFLYALSSIFVIFCTIYISYNNIFIVKSLIDRRIMWIYYDYIFHDYHNNDKKVNKFVEFKIGNKEDVNKICDRLDQIKIIKNADYCYYKFDKSHLDSKIRQGIYYMPEYTNTSTIIRFLGSKDNGTLHDYYIQKISAGMRFNDFIDNTSQLINVNSKDFHNVLYIDSVKEDILKEPLDKTNYEGTILPGMYLYNKSMDKIDIIRAMVNTTRNYYVKSNIIQDQIHQIGLSSINDLIILASIVQKEGTSKDYNKVACVLLNRLHHSTSQASPNLEVDATLNYIRGSDNISLSARDKESDSPYNTYKHKGLPPTPIAFVDYNALYATLHPYNDKKLLWYFAAENHEQLFFTNFDEFNKALNKNS